MKTWIKVGGALLLLAGAVGAQDAREVTWAQVKIGAAALSEPAAKVAVPSISVMSRNLFLGASIDPLVAALASGDPAAIAAAAAATWANIQINDFGIRSGALADEIAVHRPHLVGLQEVTSFALLTGSGPVVLVDYLEALLLQLQARGLDYAPVAVVDNISVPVPVPGVGVLLYTDGEALLARGDVAVANDQAGHYAAALSIPGVLDIPRGWVSADADIAGQSVRVFSTHLETKTYASIQEAQAAELIGLATQSPLPVVLLGDLNSGPRSDGGTGTQTYPWLVDAGFVDVWSRANRHDDGFTCCHDDPLVSPVVDFDRRIDLIWVRDGSRPAPRTTVLADVEADVIGADPAVLYQYGLWPSDHAGVVASFRLPPAGRNRGGVLAKR